MDASHPLMQMGAQYFQQPELDIVAIEVTRLASAPRAEYYQLVQRSNELNLEYAAISGNALVDVTLNPRGIRTILVPLTKIVFADFEFKKTPPEGPRLEFNIYVNITNPRVPVLTYTAVTPEATGRLHTYASAVQTTMLIGNVR